MKEAPVPVRKFLGLSNRVPEESMRPGDMTVANNVYIDDAYGLHSRPGVTLLQPGSDMHSLFCSNGRCFFVDGSMLYTTTNLTTKQAIGAVTAGRRMRYVPHGGKVYMSNGVEKFKYSDRLYDWGLEQPAHLGEASDSYGELAPGTYLYAMVYVDHNYRESGTLLWGSINVTSGGIQFTNLPVPASGEVAHKSLYVSSANGTEMYLAAILKPDTTIYNVIAMKGATRLDTLHMVPPVPSTVLAEYNGSILLADGNEVYISPAYRPELFDIMQRLTFKGPVRVIAPVKGGVYFSTDDEIVYIEGDLINSTYTVVANYGGMADSLAYAQVKDLMGTERIPEGVAAVWATQRGIVAGLSGGLFINLTEARYLPDAVQSGAGLVANIGGSKLYLVIK